MQESGKKDLRDLDEAAWAHLLKDLGQPSFRLKQIMKWVNGGCSHVNDMLNLPLGLRQALDEIGTLDNVYVERVQHAADGTAKYLLGLRDGALVEAVLMKYRYGYSVCLSTQVGCRMGCRFCASTKGGLERNLTVGELMGMFLTLQGLVEERIGHLVLMGIGEPLDNYDHVVGFMRRLHDSPEIQMSYRNMTLSTCGLIPEMDRLAKEEMPITLAVSLHAATNGERSQLMPVNNRYPIEVLLEACHRYTQATGRRLTFEYALIAGVNDGAEQAEALAALLRGGLFHVNLIPLNPIRENSWEPTRMADAQAFRQILEKKGIETTVRRSLGQDIDAACGQLRRTTLQEK